LNGLSPRPDLVVISGDIADSAQPEEYAHATKLLGALQMPFAAIPGNHDRRAPMREAFPDSLYGNANCALNTVRRVEGLDIFLMDSSVAGAAHGELDAETLVWLDGALAASATRPAFLFLHHPPFDTGIMYTDAARLRNADALAAILNRHPRVLLVAAGHAHRAAKTVFAGVSASICPAGEQAVTLEFEPRWPEVFRVEPCMASRRELRKRGHPRSAGWRVSRPLFLWPIRRRLAYKRLFLRPIRCSFFGNLQRLYF
jgi:3',5'-cyclic-AMP phosphodiesterase